MQQLHLVGFTTDLESLILSARKGTKSGGFVVRLDEQFMEVILEAAKRRDDLAEEAGSGGKGRPRPDSSLSPREIQARLRAGRGLAEVADEAGVDESWVARFEAPVQAERIQVIERARSLVYERPRRGLSAQPLGVSVRWALADKGVRMAEDEYERAWSAWQLPDQTWAVTFQFVSRKRSQTARWDLDLREGELYARNRVASELAYVEPGLRRRQLTEAASRPPTPRATSGRDRADEVELPIVDLRAPPRRRPAPAPARAPAKKTGKATKAAKSTKAKKTAGKAGAPAKKTTAARKSARGEAPADPILDWARRAPRPDPRADLAGLDELGRRRLELARARPGPLPGSGPRRPAELRRLLSPPPRVEDPPRRQSDPDLDLDPPDAHPEPDPDELAAAVAARRAERAAERRARAAARAASDDDDDDGPAALPPAEPFEPSFPTADPRVVTIRANRASPPHGGDEDEGELVSAPSRPLRPALQVTQPRRRRFGRSR